MIGKENTIRILEVICEKNHISKEELLNLLKDREYRYLMLLIFKKYGYDDYNYIGKVMQYKSKRSVTYSMKKAEEKFFINSEFREKYFKLEMDIKDFI